MLAGWALAAGCGVVTPAGKPAARPPRLGYLGASASPQLLDALRDGLRERGWDEGRNLLIEARWADGQVDRLPGLAAELVTLGVDLIVTAGSAATRAAKAAGAAAVVQGTGSSDLVDLGLAASVTRPGGSVTGLSELDPEIVGKRLEVLGELRPGLARVGALRSVVSTTPDAQLAQGAARTLGLDLRVLEVRTADELPDAFVQARQAGVQGLLVLTDPLILTQRSAIPALALQHGLPSVYDRREYVEPGGLAGYGPDVPDLMRRAAVYVDKILKGARPGDLPIERPTKFDYVLNLKTARALGLTIPQSALLQATEVIQ